MIDPTCVCGCGRPTPDGYACTDCGISRPRKLLEEIADLTPVAREVACRQNSRGDGGGGSGKPESSLPIDLHTGARLDAVQNNLATWARHVASERGMPAWDGTEDPDYLIRAARYLQAHLEWMRHRPEADEFLVDVEACARIARSLTGGRARSELAGRCDCGRILYVRNGRRTATCPDCEAVWDVEESRDALFDDLDQQLVTASEAARLAAYLYADRTQDQIRKLVNKWASRNELSVDDTGPEPRHWFGNIAHRLARTSRRAAAPAEKASAA